MSLLSRHTRTKAISLIENIILSHGNNAVVFRADSDEQLYGSDDANFVEVGTIPIEMVATPHAELNNSVDALACLLPKEDVRPEDHLKIDGETYRVQTVTKQDLFGVVTHIVLKLVRLHGC